LVKIQPVINGALSSQSGGELTLELSGSGNNQTYVVAQDGDEVARFAVRGDALVGSVGPSGGLPSPTSGGSIEGSGAIGLEVVLSRITSLPGASDEIDEPLVRDVLASLGTATQTITETPEQLTEKTQLTLDE
jgi:hypothetical protein